MFDMDKEIMELKEAFEKEYNKTKCIGMERHIDVVRLEDGRSACISIVINPCR